jgi:ABC-type branched-subunit amino acid transport system ATPase component
MPHRYSAQIIELAGFDSRRLRHFSQHLRVAVRLMFARAVADRALVMERGRLVHSATRSELEGNDPALQRLLAL